MLKIRGKVTYCIYRMIRIYSSVGTWKTHYKSYAKAKKDLSPRCLQEELVRAKSKLIEAVMEAKQKLREVEVLNPGGA